MHYLTHWNNFSRGSFLSSFCSDTKSIPVSVAAIPHGCLTLLSSSSALKTVSMNFPSELNLLILFVPQSATRMLFTASVQIPFGSFIICELPFFALVSLLLFGLSADWPNLSSIVPDWSNTFTVRSKVSVTRMRLHRSTVIWIGLDRSAPSWTVENDLKVIPSVSCMVTRPLLQSATRYLPSAVVAMPSGQSNLWGSHDNAVYLVCRIWQCDLCGRSLPCNLRCQLWYQMVEYLLQYQCETGFFSRSYPQLKWMEKLSIGEWKHVWAKKDVNFSNMT